MPRYALYAVIVFALLIGAGIVVALVITLITLAVFACVIGVPIWLLVNHLRRDSLGGRARNPIDTLKELYVEGKIDLFEFERRVARVIAIDQH